MAEKLRGMLNLSKIDKEQIFETKKGEKAIWVDIVPNYDGQPDQYGNTHAITTWSREKGKVYLGNLRPEEFGRQGQDQGQSQSLKQQILDKAGDLIPQPNDLPF